jgi:hypothetical protein
MLLTRHGRESSGVTLSRSASGETQIEVRVRAGDDDAQTADDAAAKAAELYDQLTAKYPPSSGRDDATIDLSRNAKGETQVSVKISTNARGNVTTLAEAEKLATETYGRLRGTYPLATGHVGKTAPDA